jgi:hypothetical protein
MVTVAVNEPALAVTVAVPTVVEV